MDPVVGGEAAALVGHHPDVVLPADQVADLAGADVVEEAPAAERPVGVLVDHAVEVDDLEAGRVVGERPALEAADHRPVLEAVARPESEVAVAEAIVGRAPEELAEVR
ncbi:MAG: hypothetical protein H6711_26265 [Myxococcales bacterium]|nr:hypothetical protein [Myxococcales bacterium]